MVTKLLEKAFDEAAKLSEEEQRQLAEWILAELDSDERWARAFSDSQDRLVQLADEALQEDAEGKTEDLDPMGQ
jgi:hypothetical protein